MAYTVYMHTSPSNKIYIGITKVKPKKRWGNGSRYSDNDYFYKAIKKYGWENIKHEILYEGLTQEEAYAKERELIKKYDSANRDKGYNISTGGKGGEGHKLSEESINLIKSKQKMKAVNVYDIDGIFIAQYCSISEAARQLNIPSAGNISAVCKGKMESVNQYIFRYVDDNRPIEKARKTRRPVNMLTLDGKFIRRFCSINEAAKETNIDTGGITRCCQGKLNYTRIYKWEYA